jgi:hypothetical protein
VFIGVVYVQFSVSILVEVILFACSAYGVTHTRSSPLIGMSSFSLLPLATTGLWGAFSRLTDGRYVVIMVSSYASFADLNRVPAGGTAPFQTISLRFFSNTLLLSSKFTSLFFSEVALVVYYV